MRVRTSLPRLRAGGRSLSHSKERHRARSTLVVVQVALAMLLLVGSGLMIRTFRSLRDVQPGFCDPEQVLSLHIYVPDNLIKDAVQAIRVQQNILDKLAAVPGVQSVGLTSYVPMEGSGWHDPIFAEDHVYSDGKIPPLRRFRMISPGLLKTMGNKLVAGRDFTWTDVYDKRPVALVSENMARELWQDPSRAIGKRIRENTVGQFREIVGVVSDERDDGVHQDAPTVAFWPLMMDGFSSNHPFVQRGGAIVVRSSRTGSAGFVQELSRAVWSVNADLPLADVQTLQAIYDRSLARTSFALVMLALAGGMALLLGVIGIYGVISYSVSQRTREIGIRMALGSPQQDVTRLFPVAWSAAVGARRRLRIDRRGGKYAADDIAAVFHVSPLDPLTYIGVSCGLIGAAALASFLPALRATRIDPVDALRAE
ncbi:MAG: ABC transporter permease [Ignavibacteriota bacterium]